MRTTGTDAAVFAAAVHAQAGYMRYADRIENLGTVAILGAITDATVVDIGAQLVAAKRGPVRVIINSLGGKIDAALDVIELLCSYQQDTGQPATTHVIRAFSAAGLIAQGAGHRTIAMSGAFGVHMPTQHMINKEGPVLASMPLLTSVASDDRVPGNLRALALADLQSLLQRTEDMATIYATRTRHEGGREFWRAEMAEERVYGSYAALSLGLVDEVV